MVTASSSSDEGKAAKAPPVLSIHHTALRCFDAETVRQFYQDVLGLNLAAASIFDHNGMKPVDFMHVFFRMSGGDFLAFFDVPEDLQPDFYNRYRETDFQKTLRVDSDEGLEDVMNRLSQAGVAYTGPTEHRLGKSIFFKDPDGIRVEVASFVPNFEEIIADEKKKARDIVRDWTARTAEKKALAKRSSVAA